MKGPCDSNVNGLLKLVRAQGGTWSVTRSLHLSIRGPYGIVVIARRWKTPRDGKNARAKLRAAGFDVPH